MVPRNHHPAIPLRAAFATVLSGCDAESALRVDLPCPSRVAYARHSAVPRFSTPNKPRATLHHYHCRRDQVNAPNAPVAGQSVVEITGAWII